MKYLITFLVCCTISLTGFAQNKKTDISKPDPSKKTQVVEASCGQCQFHMKAKGCSLAVRIDGKPYFVDGASIDSFGDAHAKEGFCEAIRKAEVQGTIVNNRFKVTYFRLLPTVTQ